MGQPLENEISVRVGAEIGGLRPGMEASAQEVERAAERMRQSVSAMKDNIAGHMTQMSTAVKAANDESAKEFERLSSVAQNAGSMIGMAIAATVAAIGLVTKATIDDMDRMNEEAERLSMTTESLSKLTYAGKLSGLEFNEMTQAITRLSSKMQDAVSGNKEAQNWFKDVGVSVTDASGKMKGVETVIEEVADRFAKFEKGADKTALAVDGFGRSGAKLVPMLNQGSEGIRELYAEAEQLGAVVDGKASESAAKFNDNVDRMSFLLKGAARAIVEDMLPAMNRLLSEFLLGMKYSDGFLDALMKYGLTNPFKDNAAHVAELRREFEQLDFLLSNGRSKNPEQDKERLRVLEQQLNYYRDLEALKNGGSPAAGNSSGQGSQSIVRSPSGKTKKEKVESRMPEWEAALSEQKAAYMESHDMYEMSAADEKAYWQKRLDSIDKGAKEYGSVQKKIGDLTLREMKESATQRRALSVEEIEEAKRVSNAEIDALKQTAEAQYSLGMITKAEQLEQESQFEAQRYEINRQAVEDRMALLEKDPNMNPVEYQKLKNQLLEIDRRYQLQRRQIEVQIQVEQSKPMNNVFRTMETSFSSAVTGMLTRAQTLRQGLANIFQSIFGTFVQEMVAKPLARTAMKLIEETALYQAFFGTKKTMEAADAATQIAAQKTLGITSVMSNASIAATAAMASVAAIPLVGWAMAPGVGASTYGMAMGFLPSAEGGWDIPAGATGLMRFHESEMMLPKEQANVIRDMANNGGRGGRGGDTIHVHAMDARSFERYLKDNSHAMAPGLRRMARNFTTKG